MDMTAHNVQIDIESRWLKKAGWIFTPLWLCIIVLAIAWGWSIREEGYLSAEDGFGYWLGITGGVMMLMLLTYSLRKRWKLLRRFLTIKSWFQFHMVLGILGPLLILFHSNFHLGSLNSTVALVCMLLVSGSGLIGRYLYGNIHYGLYGEKIKLKQIQDDFALLKSDLQEFLVTEKQLAASDRIFTSNPSPTNHLAARALSPRGMRSPF